MYTEGKTKKNGTSEPNEFNEWKPRAALFLGGGRGYQDQVIRSYLEEH